MEAGPFGNVRSIRRLAKPRTPIQTVETRSFRLGCKWSLVQIQSPRQYESRGSSRVRGSRLSGPRVARPALPRNPLRTSEAISPWTNGRGVRSAARRKLDLVGAAAEIRDLTVPPGNRLEKLRGDLAGFYSIRVNDQFRIIFRFEGGNASAVQLVDYH